MVAAVTMVGLRRLNIGCGDYRLPAGWTNVDESNPNADIQIHVPPLPWDAASVAEIYAGHFFEHLGRIEAAWFLDECYRVLIPGGKLGILVPDMREVLNRYVHDEPAPMEFPEGHQRDLRDLDDLCEVILFSTAQASTHSWAYDKFTLSRTLTRAGFKVIGEIDRYHDPRVAVGAWYQFGLEASKP